MLCYLASKVRTWGPSLPARGPSDITLTWRRVSTSHRFDRHRLLGEPGSFRGVPSPPAAFHVLVSLPADEEQCPAPPNVPLESRPQPPLLCLEATPAPRGPPGDPAASTELSRGTRWHSIGPRPAAAAGESLYLGPPPPPRATLLSSGNWPSMGTRTAPADVRNFKPSEPPLQTEPLDGRTNNPNQGHC
eukprot:bmy_01194T0